jgi:hypothetical protein
VVSRPKARPGFERRFVLPAHCAVPRYDQTTVESEIHQAFSRTGVVRSASAAVSRDLTKSRAALRGFYISGTPAAWDVERD